MGHHWDRRVDIVGPEGDMFHRKDMAKSINRISGSFQYGKRTWSQAYAKCSPELLLRSESKDWNDYPKMPIHFPLGIQVPHQKVLGPSKPTPNTFSEGTWILKVQGIEDCTCLTLTDCHCEGEPVKTPRVLKIFRSGVAWLPETPKAKVPGVALLIPWQIGSRVPYTVFERVISHFIGYFEGSKYF